MHAKNRDRRQGLEHQEGVSEESGKSDSTGKEASTKGQLSLTNGGELAAHMPDRIRTKPTH